jgi:amino acid adenylation domain-containing protein
VDPSTAFELPLPCDFALGSAPVLADEEQSWLDRVGRGAFRAFPAELLHRLVAQHAVATPDAIAARYRDWSLTYGQLVRRSNRVARALVARGAGAEARIAVCVEPGFDILIALLGILASGAVYVPIDPTYPAARIRAILDDTRPTVIVSRAYLIERLALADFATLALDDAAALDALDDTHLQIAIDPSQTAYIYYTSGTTGRPKGVMASHSNLIAYIQVARARYHIDRHDIVPAIARFSFSISMFELMSPLVAGGTVIILDRDHILDPVRMTKTFGEVTFFHAGPSLLKHLVPYLQQHPVDLANVRHASSGGDMIPPEILEALKQIFVRADVFVIYGCSEISCMGCTYPVPRDAIVTRTYVGRPFDNVEVRVLDAAFKPVPIGATGEILFSGGGIVKGYLHRDDLTAEKFVTLDGKRYYRTGDVGRFHDGGWLEILGRSDFQIKVRGMRVELAEVEHHLRRAPHVRDAAVTARDSANGDKVMAAYIVFVTAPADRSAALAEVRRYMVDQLPDYMVPSAYVELDRLPLNHNMKLDRNALPEPARADQRDATGRRAAETKTERYLAALWMRIFRIEFVGLDDNFFELGGDSLRAMALIVEVDRDLHAGLEGMDVLRESLEILAAICDRTLGRSEKPTRTTAATTTAIEVFHRDGLYCVLHAPARPSGHAALICAPIGQESVRTRFVLTRLAKLLAGRGTSVLLFDYFGHGDSLGDDVDATCTRWRRDITTAGDELVRRARATRVTAIGVRLGATLFSNTQLDVARLVVWDPIVAGSTYCTELREIHRRYVRGLQHLRLGRPPHRVPGAEELLGATYSDTMLRELRALALVRSDVPLRWLATHDAARQRATFQTLGGERLEVLDVDCAWADLTRIEDLLPDNGVARTLAALVEEDS